MDGAASPLEAGQKTVVLSWPVGTIGHREGGWAYSPTLTSEHRELEPAARCSAFDLGLWTSAFPPSIAALITASALACAGFSGSGWVGRMCSRA